MVSALKNRKPGLREIKIELERGAIDIALPSLWTHRGRYIRNTQPAPCPASRALPVWPEARLCRVRSVLSLPVWGATPLPAFPAAAGFRRIAPPPPPVTTRQCQQQRQRHRSPIPRQNSATWSYLIIDIKAPMMVGGLRLCQKHTSPVIRQP